MAAGLGSRYGGVKQIEPVGAHGEIIMSYAVYDAIKIGYKRIIIILRKEIEAEFAETAGYRFERMCKNAGVELVYTFQDPYDLPQGVTLPEGRTKPWGTGHAILSCRDIIDGSFIVINADDFYARETLQMMYNFYTDQEREKNRFCLAGYVLKNTLSDNGAVTRGICLVDDSNRLEKIIETKGIGKYGDKVGYENADGYVSYIDPESVVSMNMWGFGAEMTELLKSGFVKFFERMKELPHDSAEWQKGEFLIPVYVEELLQSREVTVDVLRTNAVWFGVTYKADHELVANEFKKLVKAGVYPDNLYA